MTLNKVYNGNSIEQVLELLQEFKSEAKVIAGGTDIIIALRNSKISPKVLIDIAKIEELRKIQTIDNKILIGAAVTYTQIVENELFKENLYGLYKACKMVGSPQIRNKGTIGGNIANASPAADSIPPLIALGAILKIANIKGIREVLLEDYFSDKNVYGIKDDELLISVEFEKPKDNQILSFGKLGLRKALAISRITVSTFIGLDHEFNIENIRIASGSIGKYPMREPDVEKALLGQKFNHDIIDLAVKSLQDSMDTRLKGRSTLPYKRRAVVSILEEALEDCKMFYTEVKI